MEENLRNWKERRSSTREGTDVMGLATFGRPNVIGEDSILYDPALREDADSIRQYDGGIL